MGKMSDIDAELRTIPCLSPGLILDEVDLEHSVIILKLPEDDSGTNYEHFEASEVTCMYLQDFVGQRFDQFMEV